MKMIISAALCWAGVATCSHAFCLQPSAYIVLPTPPASYQLPSVPFCVQQFRLTGQATCQAFEIDQYRDEMNRYVKQLQAYVDDAYEQAQHTIAFAKDAEAYAKCQIKQMNGQ